MQCLKCGNTLPDDSLFCQFCGTDLSKKTCFACGANLAEDGDFCPHCGYRHESSPTPAKGRRKSNIFRTTILLLAAALLTAALILLIRSQYAFQTKNEPQTVSLSPAEAAQSVLYLECYDSTGDLLSTGSGFLIQDGKTLVTNYHVMNNVHSITVFDAKGEYAADVLQVLFSSEEKDLAVLELNRDTGLLPLPLGDSEPLAQGNSIYAIGYPLGMSNTVSDGIISSIFVEDHINILQITAPISPGSSGGALLDQAGTVVGIIFARYEDGQNMNLAVAVNELKNLLTYYSSPVGLDELYLKNHPQMHYDSYEVGLKALWAPTKELAEEIQSLWLQSDSTATGLEIFAKECMAFYDCEYYEDTFYITPGILGDDFDAWFFDVDRSFGDTVVLEENDGACIYFFCEVQEIKTEVPAEGTLEETPAEETPAEEAPAEETPAEEAPVENPGCSHIWSIWAVKQPKDCTSDGYTIAGCSLCRSTQKQILPAKAHTVIVDTAKIPATCTEDGSTQSSHCSVCNAVLSTKTTIPALGHNYADGFCIRCNGIAPTQNDASANENTPPSASEEPLLTKEILQGKWVCTDIDGIYGRSQEYVFYENQFYWNFWKGGTNDGGSDAIEDKTSGTYTINGNNIYLSNGLVGTVSGKYLYINGLTFYRI